MKLVHLFIGLGLAVVAYQIYVTVRVATFEAYSRIQKTAQLVLVWLVPFFGALVVHLVLYGLTSKPREKDRHFTPETTGPA